MSSSFSSSVVSFAPVAMAKSIARRRLSNPPLSPNDFRAPSFAINRPLSRAMASVSFPNFATSSVPSRAVESCDRRSVMVTMLLRRPAWPASSEGGIDHQDDRTDNRFTRSGEQQSSVCLLFEWVLNGEREFRGAKVSLITTRTDPLLSV